VRSHCVSGHTLRRVIMCEARGWSREVWRLMCTQWASWLAGGLLSVCCCVCTRALANAPMVATLCCSCSVLGLCVAVVQSGVGHGFVWVCEWVCGALTMHHTWRVLGTGTNAE
jgi:hypothetical protein